MENNRENIQLEGLVRELQRIIQALQSDLFTNNPNVRNSAPYEAALNYIETNPIPNIDYYLKSLQKECRSIIDLQTANEEIAEARRDALNNTIARQEVENRNSSNDCSNTGERNTNSRRNASPRRNINIQRNN